MARHFARERGAIVIEDDYDGEFRYDGSPLEALRTADAADVVFYVGTFSKCMLPALPSCYGMHVAAITNVSIDADVVAEAL